MTLVYAFYLNGASVAFIGTMAEGLKMKRLNESVKFKVKLTMILCEF